MDDVPIPAKDMLAKTASPFSDVMAQDRYDAARYLDSLRKNVEKTVKLPHGSEFDDCKRTVTAGVKKAPATKLVGNSSNDMEALL